MGLFDKQKEPIFLKETSDAKDQLEKLKSILNNVSSDVKPKIEQDIKILTYGIYGEDNIAFELKNSHLPMYVLHDLYLEYNGLTAQIDFLIITKKRIFVIECKNLIGNIEINSNGDFIRTIEFYGKSKKEGIYSPITQNQRHMELIKQLRANSKGNFFTKAMFEKYFYDSYRSVVVLANPKTLLNSKYAKKDVKEKVIRADQLIEHIKRVNKEPDSNNYSEKEMEQIAQFFLQLHTQNKVDYLEKYNKLLNNEKSENVELPQKQNFVRSDTESTAYTKLKEYRLKKSREENIKPYFIYNDKQLEDLLIKNPKKIEDLTTVSGFGEAKCKKYGGDILKILGELS